MISFVPLLMNVSSWGWESIVFSRVIKNIMIIHQYKQTGVEQILVFKLQIKFTSTWETQLKTYAPFIPHLSFFNRCKNSDDETWSYLYLSHIHKINNHLQKVLSETLQRLGTSLQQYLFRENWFNWIERFVFFF